MSSTAGDKVVRTRSALNRTDARSVSNNLQGNTFYKARAIAPAPRRAANLIVSANSNGIVRVGSQSGYRGARQSWMRRNIKYNLNNIIRLVD